MKTDAPPDSIDTYMEQLKALEELSSFAPKKEEKKEYELDPEIDAIDFYSLKKNPINPNVEDAQNQVIIIQEEEYQQLLNSEGEVDQDEYHKFKKRKIEDLPEIDHSSKSYNYVEKKFYTPHNDILALQENEVRELR